jgi:hypothetical protein
MRKQEIYNEFWAEGLKGQKNYKAQHKFLAYRCGMDTSDPR